MIQLVGDFECLRHAGHQRVVGRVHRDFELAVFVVAPRAAAHQGTIVLRPVGPIIPQRRMHQQQAVARVGKIENDFAHCRVGHRLVVAQVKHVEFLERG